jgi:hypothetical protein
VSALTFLSFRPLSRLPRDQPRPPSNEDRLRALRNAMPTEIGNGYPWPHTQGERYAAGEREQEPMNYADRRGM